jgi:hypothetical protein
MTRSDFESTMQHRISVLRSLEYRAKRAHALGLKITGWVLTKDEASAVWVEGTTPLVAGDAGSIRLPVRRVIDYRLPQSKTVWP